MFTECDCNINNYTEVNIFTNIDISMFVNDVYSGHITEEKLNKVLYLKIATEYEKKLNIGWGSIPNKDLDKKSYSVYFGMLESLYVFSAAKQYQLIRELILDKKNSKNYHDYLTTATITFKKYNVKYFSIELEMCEIQGISANKWMDFVKWNDEPN